MAVRRRLEDFAQTTVERRYQERLNGMSIPERGARVVGLWHTGWQATETQLHHDLPNISPEDIPYERARRMYRNEPETLRLLERAYRNG